MSSPQDDLRARQGSGARYDAPEAPLKNLLLARRAFASFARYLNALTDDQLPDHARRIANVSYIARGLAEAIEAIRTGQPVPDPHQTLADRTEAGATLPPRALRSLFKHATQHLNVEWRDLSAFGWQSEITLPGGPTCAVMETPCLIAEIFQKASNP